MRKQIFNFFSGMAPSSEKKTSSESIDEESPQYEKLAWYEKIAVSAAKNRLGSVKSYALKELAKHLDHSEGIEQIIEPQLKSILEFLKNLDLGPKVLGLMENSPERVEEFLKDIAITLLANIADEVVEEHEKVSMDELADRTSWFLIRFIGENFNEIDKQVAEGQQVTPELFHPFIDKILAICLKNSGMLGKLLGSGKVGLKEILASKLQAAYGDFDKKLKGEAVQEEEGPNLEALNPLFKDATQFLLNALVSGTGKRDLECIAQLTQETKETVEIPLKFLSEKVASLLPAILPDFLKGDGKELQISQLLTDQLVANFIRNRYAKELEKGEKISLAEVFKEVSNYLVIEVSGHVKHHRIEELPLKLLKVMLPPDLPFVMEFLERRKDPLLKPVDDICASFADRIYEGPERLEDLWNQELDGLQGDKEVLKKNVKTLSEKTLTWGLGEVEGLFKDVPEQLNGVKDVLKNEWVVEQLDRTIKKSFLNVLQNLLKIAKKNGAQTTDEVIPRIIEELLKFGEDSFSDTLTTFKELDVENPRAWLETRLNPVTAQFIAQFLPNDLLKMWPVPSQFQEQLQKVIQEKLNGFVVELFTTYAVQSDVDDTEALQGEIRNSLNELSGDKESLLEKVNVWAESSVTSALRVIPIRGSVAVNAQITLTVRRMFYRTVLKMVNLAKENGAQKCDTLIPSIIGTVFGANREALSGIYEDYNHFKEGKSKEERLVWVQNALKEITAKLYTDLVSKDLLEVLPIPKNFHGQIHTFIQETLNEFMGELFITFAEKSAVDDTLEVKDQIVNSLDELDGEKEPLLEKMDEWAGSLVAMGLGLLPMKDSEFINAQVSLTIRRALYRTFLKMVNLAKENGADKCDAIIPTVIKKVFDLNSERLAGIYEAYSEFKVDKSEDECRTWVQAALKEVTAQLYSDMIPEGLLDVLPVPQQFQGQIHALIKEKLNEFAVEFFTTFAEQSDVDDTALLQEEIGNSLDGLNGDKAEFLEKMNSLVEGSVLKGLDFLPIKGSEALNAQVALVIRRAMLRAFHKMVNLAKENGALTYDEIIPAIIRKVLKDNTESLPEIYDAYIAFKEGKSEKQRLAWIQNALGELTAQLYRDMVPENLLDVLPIPKQFNGSIEKAVQGQLSLVFAQFFMALVENMESDEPEVIFDEIKNELTFPEADAEPLLKQIRSIVKQAVTAGHNSIEDLVQGTRAERWVMEQTDRTIQKSVMLVILELVKKAKSDGADSPEAILPKIIEKALQIGGISLPAIYQAFQGVEGDKEEWAREQLKGLSSELIKQFIPEELFQTLPIPEALRANVNGIIQDQVNKLLSDFFIAYVEGMEVNDPLKLRQAIGDVLSNFTKKNSPLLEMIDAIAEYVEDIAVDGIKNAMPFVQEENIEKGQWLLSESKSVVRSLIYRIFLMMLKNANNNGVNSYEKILPFMYDQLIGFCDQHLPDIYSYYCEEKAGRISSKRLMRRLERRLKPVSEEFLKQFVTEDLTEVLPLPKQFQGIFSSTINSFFAKLFAVCVDAMANEGDSEAKLNQLFQKEETNNDALPVVKLCHMAGKFAEGGIPFVFRENRDEWAKTLVPSLLQALNLTEDRTNNRITATILRSLFDRFGESENQPMMQFLGRFVESLLMKFMGELAQNISDMEANNTDSESLLEQAVLLIATEAKNHFEILADNRKLLKRGDLNGLKDAFREAERLHPGMEKVDQPGQNEKSTAPHPIFQTWAMKLAVLMGMKQDELPLPQFLQSKVWGKLQEELLPLLLELMFNSVRDPNTLRAGLIAALESFDQEFDAKKNKLQSLKEAFLPAGNPDNFAQEVDLKLFEDEFQEKLKEELGEAAYHFIRMHPSLFAGFMLRFKKIKGLVGQTVGQTLREQVRDVENPENATPFIEFMDNGFKAIVETLMPCERNEEGDWVYYDTNPLGERIDTPLEAPNLSHIYPEGHIEKHEATLRADIQSRRNAARIMRGLPKVIQKEADLMLEGILNKPYDKFATFCVKAARKIGRGRFGDTFAKGMKKFLWFIRRFVIAPILLAVTLPVWLPIKAIIHLVLKKQGRSRVEDLDQEIMGNLFFHLFDKIFGKFTEQMVEENPA